jgi:hypothetical protein
MRNKNAFIRRVLGIHLDKPDHEAINTARKLSHEAKAKADLAKYREAQAKGEARAPRKGKNSPIHTIEYVNFN